MRKLKPHELGRISADEFKFTKKMPVVIALDNVRSMHNVGSVFRTADAFLVERVYLCGITPVPPHREISKTALGAEDSVEWRYVADLCGLIDDLKQDGYLIIGVEQVDEAVQLNEFTFNVGKKYCIIFGNEMFGIDDEVLARVDSCLEIPQYGTKHSLNVSVAVGITVWDVFAKLRGAGYVMAGR
jgi:23S rRNA (guanosine2251-2'-O)-methyltransferase